MNKNNNYTTGNSLDNKYFSNHYKPIAIDLSKQIESENLNLKQQINFIDKFEDNGEMLFIIKRSEQITFLTFHKD